MQVLHFAKYMNIILLEPSDFSTLPTRVTLTDRRFEHIRNIHRAQRGDTLRVGVLNGQLGSGIIERMDDSSVQLSIQLETTPPPPSEIELVLALPRPRVFNRILIAACTLGIKKLHFIHSKRVEKSFWSSPVLSDANIKSQLIVGLEQARDTVLPNVFFHKRFKPFVEDVFPQLIQESTTAYIAHPAKGPACPSAPPTPLSLVLGPEGGFIDYEVEKFIEAGCQPIHFGKRILRVETALAAIIGRLTRL